MNKHLIAIASFDLIKTDEWIDPFVFVDLPEREPYNYNFAQCEYESTQLIANISVVVWMYAFNGLMFLLFYIPIWVINRVTRKLA